MSDTKIAAPSLNERLRYLGQALLPQRALTRLVYALTRIQQPWFKNLCIRLFVRYFQIDMYEALLTKPEAYTDFNAFFTRALKPDARPIVRDKRVICCPVDGTVSQIGNAAADTLLQAKGRTFSVSALLGDAQLGSEFAGGAFATLYLAPRDYHRIHIPLDGQLREMLHIPGKLHSVSPLTTRMVPDLFARNERVVTIFDTAAGPMALVLVGAINVASIATVWAGTITPPLGTTVQRWQYPTSGDTALRLARAAELGRFNMGSTVIVLFAAERIRWERELQPGSKLRFGQRLGKIGKASA